MSKAELRLIGRWCKRHETYVGFCAVTGVLFLMGALFAYDGIWDGGSMPYELDRRGVWNDIACIDEGDCPKEHTGWGYIGYGLMIPFIFAVVSLPLNTVILKFRKILPGKVIE